jgi:ketosteroid isomerase-like protein
MAVSRDEAIQEMLDKHAIREVIYRYCRGVDRGDVELLSSCYHPDAFDDHAGRTFNGLNVAQGLVDWMTGLTTSTTHNITTHLIEVNADKAAAESYTASMHTQTIEGKPKLLLSISRYVDRFERRDGEWKIIHRVVVTTATGHIPFEEWPFPTLASRDKSDPSYAAFESVKKPSED